MICKKCLKRNEDGAKFCLNCGNNLENQSPVIFCTDCFEVVDENGKFCEKCGAPINPEFTEDKMLTKKVDIKNKGIYQNAIITGEQDGVSTSKYEMAIKLLEGISGYKDADTLIDHYTEIIRERKEKADLGRQVAKQKNAKIIKKLGIISGILLVLILGTVLLVNNVIKPGIAYNEAVALLEDKQYQEAYEVFNTLGSYKDSSELANESSYLYAKSLLDEQQYYDAYKIFDRIGEYKDSQNLAYESKYQYAKALMESTPEGARTAFNELGEYADSIEMVDQCTVLIIQAKLNVQDYKSASEELSFLTTTSEAYKSIYSEVYYQWGLAMLAEDGLDEGEAKLKKAAASYKDVDSYLKLILFLKSLEGTYEWHGGNYFNEYYLWFQILNKQPVVLLSLGGYGGMYTYKYEATVSGSKIITNSGYDSKYVIQDTRIIETNDEGTRVYNKV